LRDLVQGMLDDRFSPEQISRRLRRDHPDRPELHVTHETIYQALYVQGGVSCAASSPAPCAPAAPSASPGARPVSASPGSLIRW
jgi:IS30 family transposase